MQLPIFIGWLCCSRNSLFLKRDRSSRHVSISQSTYITDLLQEYQMSSCNPVTNPCVVFFNRHGHRVCRVVTDAERNFGAIVDPMSSFNTHAIPGEHNHRVERNVCNICEILHEPWCQDSATIYLRSSQLNSCQVQSPPSPHARLITPGDPRSNM